MGVAQSYQSAQNSSAQARLNADTLETQAARNELEAEEALAIGRLNQAEQVIKGRQEIAEQRVAYAASGMKVNEGSAVEVAADQAAWSEYQRQKVGYEAGLESWGCSTTPPCCGRRRPTSAPAQGRAMPASRPPSGRARISPPSFSNKNRKTHDR